MKSQEHLDRIQFPDGEKFENTKGSIMSVFYEDLSLDEKQQIMNNDPSLASVVSYLRYREMRKMKEVLRIIQESVISL